jgi:eukaryotic-like serine/threonine-protein kinase
LFAHKPRCIIGDLLGRVTRAIPDSQNLYRAVPMPDSGDSIEESALNRIVLVCDSYEAAWRANRAPDLRAFLEKVEPGSRDVLLLALIAIDVELHLERGTIRLAKDYIDQIPDRAALIEETFEKRWPGGVPTNRIHGQDSLERTPAHPAGLSDIGTASTLDGEIPQALPVRLGRYIPTAILGGGGFGTVYLALDEELNRHVAIKVPKTEAIASRAQLESLLTEARLAANLRHPAIVRVLDISPQGDEPLYVVLEYIDGRTLADVLNNDRPPQRPLVEILVRVCEAVEYAHKAGLVHRDLKPSNILIDAAGNPFVADFGLAINEDLERLRWGEIAGTPRFMAPEQVRGEIHRLDGRTDLWAIGVILYLGLTGRPPFVSRDRDEIFDEILNRDPKPPRLCIGNEVPRELERICLKCLAKRMGDRYQTAADLVEDLKLWLSTVDSTDTVTATPDPDKPEGHDLPIPVVPKGLRAFDVEDADFFLSLLPGPRDRDGLPESIRAWKARIDSTDPSRSFPVGLLYGPSGCGKTSLVKAGLLPRLAAHVTPIYIDASSDGTESRLLAALRRKFPGISAGSSLIDAAAALREGTVESPETKVLFVLDQFEQWLHLHLDDPGSELLHAIRQCDGRRLQTLVLVRDDFWMGITRFLRAVEVPVQEGQNAAAVELFQAEHARRVLTEIGRAHGRLPLEAVPIGSDAAVFLDQAVQELAGPGGWIIPVHLSLFAETVKHRPWTPKTLVDLGGIAGIGVTFLEETFAAPHSPPAHRLHRRAAMAVLAALLPEPSSDLKGRLQPGRALQQAAGYHGRDRDFADLMSILDQELRMVTPVDALGSDGTNLEPTRNPGERHYQLTHDFLVPPLRLWLTRKQRETRRGRAELCLAERTALWTQKPESKQLPSRSEWLSIRGLTRRSSWTGPQARMMKAAGIHHMSRLALVLGVCGLLSAVAIFASRRLHERTVARELQELPRTDLRFLSARLDALEPDYEIWGPLAERTVRDEHAGVEARTRAAAALARHDPEHLDFLLLRLLDTSPPEHFFLRSELFRWRETLAPRLWQVAGDSAEKPPRRLAAASALAAYQSTGDRWKEIARAVVRELINLDPLLAGDWVRALGPARVHLREPLLESFSEKPAQMLASSILTEYGEADDDFMSDDLLAGLILSANRGQYSVLLPLVRKRLPQLIGRMTASVSEHVPMTSSAEDTPSIEQRVEGQANAAETLLFADHPEEFWPRLRQSDDPRLRTRLIDRLTAPAVSIEDLIERLNAEPDGSIRQAILIGLGSGFTNLEPKDRNRHAERLLSLYKSDPDPGVHGALEWLLSKWGFDQQVLEITRSLAGKPRGANRWFVTSKLHTMIVVRAPGGFAVGSPAEELERDENEDRHEVEITYAFAVSACEITRGQYQEFTRGEEGRRLSDDDKLPVSFVTWADAAGYCNWLSGKEKIPSGKEAYPNLAKNSSQDTPLPPDFLKRRGFRLPTEHEWEYIARAGAATSRFFGNADKDLDNYAWYVINSRGRGPKPVGQFRPNPLGFFDIYGNVDEWCEIWPAPREPDVKAARGGTYRGTPKFMRSAMPHVQFTGDKFSTRGFRIAITVDAP